MIPTEEPGRCRCGAKLVYPTVRFPTRPLVQYEELHTRDLCVGPVNVPCPT